jgi:hypothetical protein
MANSSSSFRLLPVAAAFAMLAGFCSQSDGSGPINVDNFKKIHDGMSRNDVESILGKGTAQDNGVVKRIEGPASRVDLIVTRSDALWATSSTMPEKVAHDIESLPGVERTCSGLISFSSVNELGSDSLGIQGWPVGNYMFEQLKATSGEILGEKHRGQKAVIVGEELARLKSVKVGNTLTISDDKYHVVGVFKSESDLENSMVIMLLDDAQRTLGQAGRITGCTVTLKDKSPEGVEAAKQKIEAQIAAQNNVEGKIRAKQPDQSTYEFKKMSMVWKDGNRVIFVGFLDDKVILKAQVGF